MTTCATRAALAMKRNAHAPVHVTPTRLQATGKAGVSVGILGQEGARSSAVAQGEIQ